MNEPTPFDAWQMDYEWNEERVRRDLARMVRTADMDCESCGKPFRKHPRHPEWEFLHEVCDGRLVKL